MDNPRDVFFLLMLAFILGFIFLLGIRILVYIGVILAREATERGFDLTVIRVPSNSKDFVESRLLIIQLQVQGHRLNVSMMGPSTL